MDNIQEKIIVKKGKGSFKVGDICTIVGESMYYYFIDIGNPDEYATIPKDYCKTLSEHRKETIQRIIS